MTLALAYLRHAFAQMMGQRQGEPGRHFRVVDHMHHVTPLALSSRIVLGYIADIAYDAGLEVEVNIPQRRFHILRLRPGIVDPDFPRQYLFEAFVETDIRRGFPARDQALMIGRRAGMTVQSASAILALGLHPGQVMADTSEEEFFRQLNTGEDPVERPVRDRPLRQTVIDYVTQHPGLTATQVANALDELPASVSSVLVREVNRQNLRREAGRGPRGGWAYFPLVPHVAPEPIRGPSVWERLRQNSFET